MKRKSVFAIWALTLGLALGLMPSSVKGVGRLLQDNLDPKPAVQISGGIVEGSVKLPPLSPQGLIWSCSSVKVAIRQSGGGKVIYVDPKPSGPGTCSYKAVAGTGKWYVLPYYTGSNTWEFEYQVTPASDFTMTHSGQTFKRDIILVKLRRVEIT